jgi:hypothetical protein
MPAERSFAPLGKLPALVLLALGLPPLLVGAFRAIQVLRSIAPLEVAEGTVVANEPRSRPDPEGSRTFVRSYYPVVTFTTHNGQAQGFIDATGTSPAQYSVGDTIRVLYDPHDPSQAFVGSWRNTWQEPATYLALGLLPLLILAIWAAWTFTLARERQS